VAEKSIVKALNQKAEKRPKSSSFLKKQWFCTKQHQFILSSAQPHRFFTIQSLKGTCNHPLKNYGLV